MSEDKMIGIGAIADAISKRFTLKTHWKVEGVLPQPAQRQKILATVTEV